MTLPSADSAQTDAASGPAGPRTALGLLVRMAAFGAALTLTVAAIVWLPDGNDYGLATRLKHARLAAQDGPKVVFVGGSNLAFGLESDLVEQELGWPAVNMGMNGYFGVRLMLEEVKPALRPGDVVVLAFEHDNFFKSVDGTPADLLMLVKARPATLGALTWSQRAAVFGTMPYAAQQKVLRLMREAMALGRAELLTLAGRTEDEAPTEGDQAFETIRAIESVAGFDEQGDLNSHIGVDWPFEREDGIDSTTTPVDGEVVDLISAFAAEVRERGVTVVLSYTPVLDTYYARNRLVLESLHDRLRRSAALAAPSPPGAFSFPEEYFFDTVYHLNEEGRLRRTQQLVHDLQEVLAARSSSTSTFLSRSHTIP